ncbi:long-subunit acyl-CoA synthetase (AMP-forming) [Crossiella equi]|uniref:Acyl-CoA synthetase n=1 Tax=Crossiella equi TaxID=130796 RepID=A0ABS5APU0_9PSEU|nr:long-chain fatty acid--CoA ligase [Crossiella equi]MBP2478589.1 long-subunit acyl-CoA synthetase (AMP-forming) [Crossiella equi]
MSAPTPRTLCTAFQSTARVRPDQVALRTPDDSLALTWADYARRVRSIARGLHALGVRRGDSVALMLTNRPEFHLLDCAALHLGATPFSLYNTLATDQITHVLRNAGNRIVVCERQFAARLAAADTDRQVEHVVCVDGQPEGAVSLAELEGLPANDFDFDASWQAVRPEDVATIIYTSGTTGPPKGVELTHANLLAELDAMAGILQAGPDDSVVSYLPDAHIANRWGSHYTGLAHGVQIITLADHRQLVAVLPRVRPTLLGAVPQVWYKLKAGIEAKVAAEPVALKRKLATWALATGAEVARRESDRRPVPPLLRAQHRLADRLVLAALRRRLGLDRVRFAVSGAAAIAPDALAFVLGLGLPVCELWGMSETSGVATINRPGRARLGTVGTVVPGGTELATAEDGELLVRGPLVMRGYRGEPGKTAEAVDAEGWLHTGDIATIDADGYVRIIDRKKELIINSAGKNLSPANIENAVKIACPLVGSVVAVGDDRPYVVALLTLDPDARAALAGDADVRALVEQGIHQGNSTLSRVEQVKKFVILPGTWEPGGEELTPTMKLKRRAIITKYAGEIDGLYA